MNRQIKFEYKQEGVFNVETIEGNKYVIEMPTWELDINTLKILSGNDQFYCRSLYKDPKYTNSPNFPTKEKEYKEESCGICYNPMNKPIVLNCSHKFCFNCVDNFDEYNITKCPMCRADIYLKKDSIETVMVQCKCSRKTAITELIKNNGNVIDVILSIL